MRVYTLTLNAGHLKSQFLFLYKQILSCVNVVYNLIGNKYVAILFERREKN